MSCFWCHDWGKWEQYERKFLYVHRGKEYDAVESRQKRYCKDCNYEQDEKVD